MTDRLPPAVAALATFAGLCFLMAFVILSHAIPAWQAGGWNASFPVELGKYGTSVGSETVKHAVGTAALWLVGMVVAGLAALAVNARSED